MSDSVNYPETQTPRSRLWLVVLLIAVVALAAYGIVTRLQSSAQLKRETQEDAVPMVAIVRASKGGAVENIVLPGTVEAWHDAPIYARTSGYLKSWNYDIGSSVKASDVLAEIDTPEIDAQLAQAQADLKVAEANSQLAGSTALRWQELAKANAASRQEIEEKTGDAAAKRAAVLSARANLERLRKLESFKHVTAPFDGVITARNTDKGALINAGSGTSSGQELFHIAQTDTLRIYVQVPQNYASAITQDLTAEAHFPDHPEQDYAIALAKTSNALDPTSRSLLAEFNLKNPGNALLAGGYAEVHMKLPTNENNVRLPANTLIFRAAGLQVATLNADDTVQLKPVSIARDFGTDVEINDGVAPDETVIVNPPDSLVTGQKVKIVQADALKNNGLDDKDKSVQEKNSTGKSSAGDESKK